MLPKINLYACLAAVVLFFLPWFYLPSAGQMAIVSQSGIGACYGGTSVVMGLKPETPRKAAVAPFVIIALLATVAAAMQALSAFRDGWLSLRVGLATGVALVCLLGQAEIGFPLQEDAVKSINARIGSYEPMAGLMPQGLSAMTGLIAYRWPFYLEIVALSIPTLLLMDGVANTLKRRR